MTALKLATKHLYHAANQHLSLRFDTLFFYFELHDIRINVELNYAWIIEAFVQVKPNQIHQIVKLRLS